MARQSGGISHDYKHVYTDSVRAGRGYRWPWFAAGLLLPVVGVLAISGRPDAASPAGPDLEVTEAPVVVLAMAAETSTRSVPMARAPEALPATESLPPPDAPDRAADGVESIAADVTAPPRDAPPADVTSTPAAAPLQVALRAAPNPLVLAPPPDDDAVQAAMNREAAPAGPMPGHDLHEAGAVQTVALRVARGDTLERMFRRHELSVSDMFTLLRDDQARRHLSILRPGDIITVEHVQGRVLTLSRELDEIRVLEVARAEQGYRSAITEQAVETRVVTAQAIIQSSLFNAGRAAGMPDSVTMNVAGLFQWDVDFALDIRQGDQFSVVYQELWRDGQRLRTGNILAAEFVNRGRTYRAVRFDMGDRADYFTPEGRSIRRAFIRAPVDFTRISSRFNLNRRHPVLHTIRAHRGVDYAAPTGTPIKAAGDGRVIFRGVQGGYGNTVIVQHGGNITTLYAHMSRFHPEVRHGNRVRQGQVIGYVGMTGLATGPHLHYEYRVNGVHRDPLTVELPPAEPVPAAYRERFARETAPLLAFLDRAQDASEAQLAMSGR